MSDLSFPLDSQYLIVDADDTLWENNIYFEEAFDRFVEFLQHDQLSPTEIRDILDAIEAVNAKVHGYGSKNFGRNLIQTFEKIEARPASGEERAAMTEFAHAILEHPIVLRPGVEETLPYLVERHHLTLFTKGHPEEQAAKVKRSGLAAHFRHVGIVKEKEVAAYARLAEEQGFAHQRTWMIGNSPKSDVNPALAAGLHAVYIPHPRTWILEKEEIVNPGPGQLLTLENFGQLRGYF